MDTKTIDNCNLVWGEDGCLSCIYHHKLGEECLLDKEETKTMEEVIKDLLNEAFNGLKLDDRCQSCCDKGNFCTDECRTDAARDYLETNLPVRISELIKKEYEKGWDEGYEHGVSMKKYNDDVENNRASRLLKKIKDL